MKIKEIDVADFGVWHDLKIGQLSEGATVFYGPNEAGKTTLLNFVRTVFYGFSEKRCNRYLPPAKGTRAGGSLLVDSINGTFRIERFAPATYQGGPGSLNLASPAGGHQGSSLLTTILAGVDETIFNNVFAVGLTQMQQLATLSDTEAANQLYGLASGVDRVSLFDVQRQLVEERSSLLSNDPNNPNSAAGRIDELVRQRDRLAKEIKTLERDADHWVQLRQEAQQLASTIRQKEQLRTQFAGAGDWNELSGQIRDGWKRCQTLHRKLEQLGPVVDVPKHIASRVAELTEQFSEQRKQWEQLREERRKLKSHGGQTTGRDALYRHAAEIESLDRQRHRLSSIETDVRRASERVEELEFERQAQLEELGLHRPASGRLPQLSEAVVAALHEPAQETEMLRRRVEATRQIAEERRNEAKNLKQRLQAESHKFGGEDVASQVDRSEELIARLEQRIDLDHSSQDLSRRMIECDQERQHWLQRGVLPWTGILTMCLLFSVGAAMFGSGLLGDYLNLQDKTSWWLIFLGAVLALLAVIIKSGFENSAEQQSNVAAEQLDRLRQRAETLREEMRELDESLPSGGGPLDQRLLEAQQRMDELQSFLPLRNQLQAVQDDAVAAEQAANVAVQQLKDARRGWKASLQTVGLPDSLTPEQFGQISLRFSEIVHFRNQIQAAENELHDRRQELETVRERLNQLNQLAEITAVDTSLTHQLDRLMKELDQQSRSGREREQLRSKWESLGHQMTQLQSHCDRLLDHRRQLLIGHGLTGMKDFRQSHGSAKRGAALRKERDDLLQAMHGILGDSFTTEKLQRQLDQQDDAVLRYVEKVDASQHELGADLAELYERNGQLKQQLEGQLQDRRLDHKQYQLRVIEQKIKDLSQRWLRSAVMTRVLDGVREDYETKRQPVTLAEASRYLERLTRGHYTRIWTPMGQDSLCVEDEKGRELTIERLSRGTREQVFLSLRLALVGSYKRRGSVMPFILDDVFVNFDDQRAQATAQVLAEVAKAGQQMMIFTCHTRIREIFAELQCDVRDLPTRDVVPAPLAPRPVPSNLTESDPVELPVYDAEAWDAAIEPPAFPIASNTQAGYGQRITQPTSSSIAASTPSTNDRYDDFLEPLPDLAPVSADDDAWLDEYYLGDA